MRVLFDPFVLDTERRLLSRDGDEVHLSPKAYELLTLLVERARVPSRSPRSMIASGREPM